MFLRPEYGPNRPAPSSINGVITIIGANGESETMIQEAMPPLIGDLANENKDPSKQPVRPPGIRGLDILN
jgi:hypothetical protein